MVQNTTKAELNRHTLLNLDCHNLGRSDNHLRYAALLQGYLETPMHAYLLNLNHARWHDYKSIRYYNTNNIAAKLNQAGALSEAIGKDAILLPDVTCQAHDFYEVVLGRKSCRTYQNVEMNQTTLSTILKFAFGLNGDKPNYEGIDSPRRVYGSGGGLYPIEVMIYINRVSDMRAGFYRYQPHSHSLEIVGYEAIDRQAFFAGDNVTMATASFFVFYCYTTSSNYLKYGELSLLNALTELGGMAHQFELTCVANAHAAVTIAGINKKRLEDMLGLDGVTSHVLLASACGREDYEKL